RTGGQSLPFCLDQLRPACRFRPGDADLSLPQHLGGAEFLTGAIRRRSPRLGQDEPGQSHLCLARTRQFTAYERRAVQISRQSRSDPRALPRRIAGLYRRDRGPRRLHVRGHGLGSSLGTIRTPARARRDHRPPGAAAAGRRAAGGVGAPPAVPTIAEAGVPGYDPSSWFAFFGPAKTPAEIIFKMHADTVAALAEPQIRAKLDTLGVVVVGFTPEQL